MTEKPLVLLDVDGVVNDLLAFTEKGARVMAQRHTLNGFAVYLPKYMPELVQKLVRHNEVRWCTTWREQANQYIAPLLGIPALEVVTDGSSSRYVNWKDQAAVPHVRQALAQGREVYWIEDFDRRFPKACQKLGVHLIDTAPQYVLQSRMLPAHLLDGKRGRRRKSA